MALALNGILITANMSGNTTYKQVLPKHLHLLSKLSAVLSYLSVVCQ